jgi:hypothetical protein
MDSWSAEDIIAYLCEKPEGADHSRLWPCNQGCDGYEIARDGRDYEYLWVYAVQDWDLQTFVCVEVRTHREPKGEMRDCLFFTVGIYGNEHRWLNIPVRFQDATADQMIDALNVFNQFVRDCFRMWHEEAGIA